MHPFVHSYYTNTRLTYSSLPGASRIGSRHLYFAKDRFPTEGALHLHHWTATWTATCTAPPSSPARLPSLSSLIPQPSHTIPPASQSISIQSVCFIAGRNQSDRLLVCARARLHDTLHPSWLPARTSRKPTLQPTHTRLIPTTTAHHVAPGNTSGHHLLLGLRTVASEHHLHTHHQGHPVGQLPGL
jgi:hypothetical protein